MAIGTNAGLALEIRGLRAGFTEQGRASREILGIRHFRIEGGAQVAIFGPAGSGKTTLLHLVAGLERPWRGSIHCGEVDVAALSGRPADRWRRETIGLVFQQFHLYPGLTALENVVLPLRFDRRAIDADMRARAHKLLDRVGVPFDADCESLSRGEQQRVAVARAMLRKPAIVLADEPTGSLDRDTANVIADFLCTICRGANATLVVTTDDPALACRFDAAYDVDGGDLRPRSPVAGRPPLRTAA